MSRRKVAEYSGVGRAVKVYKDSDTGEYIARLYVDGKLYEPTDYFTDDLQDALHTAVRMKGERGRHPAPLSNPRNSRVAKCVRAVKRKRKRGAVNAYAVCTKSTGQAYKTGKRVRVVRKSNPEFGRSLSREPHYVIVQRGQKIFYLTPTHHGFALDTDKRRAKTYASNDTANTVAGRMARLFPQHNWGVLQP